MRRLHQLQQAAAPTVDIASRLYQLRQQHIAEVAAFGAVEAAALAGERAKRQREEFMADCDELVRAGRPLSDLRQRLLAAYQRLAIP